MKMRLSVSSRREQLSRNIRGKNTRNNYENIPAWRKSRQKRYFRQIDDIMGYKKGLEDIDLKDVQLEGGTASVYEEGTTYEIVKYSFANPNDESEIFEIKEGSLVTLSSEEEGDYFYAEINYLYFFNDEEDNVCIEADFESLEGEDIPSWASIDSIVHVCRSTVIE